MMSSTLKWILMIVMIWPLVLLAQSSDYFVDQRHDLEDVEATHSIQSLSPVVQEFTPSIGGLDVIEIWTESGGQPLTNGGGAVLQVLVREDTINGMILGESATFAAARWLPRQPTVAMKRFIITATATGPACLNSPLEANRPRCHQRFPCP